MIHSSIFCAQMNFLHTAEYYLVGSAKKRQLTLPIRTISTNPKNRPLLNLHVFVQGELSIRMAIKAINLKRH